MGVKSKNQGEVVYVRKRVTEERIKTGTRITEELLAKKGTYENEIDFFTKEKKSKKQKLLKAPKKKKGLPAPKKKRPSLPSLGKKAKDVTNRLKTFFNK